MCVSKKKEKPYDQDRMGLNLDSRVVKMGVGLEAAYCFLLMTKSHTVEPSSMIKSLM